MKIKLIDCDLLILRFYFIAINNTFICRRFREFAYIYFHMLRYTYMYIYMDTHIQYTHISYSQYIYIHCYSTLYFVHKFEKQRSQYRKSNKNQ